MVEQRVIIDGNGYIKLEEDEDDFRSCCEDEDEPKKIEEENVKLDEHFARMYFKGVSVVGPSDSPGSRISGVGVVIEKSGDDCEIRVQKRLDFYVDELVADYLALLDGFSVAIGNGIRHVYAFTDSEVLHNQISNDDVIIESPLLLALRERIKEQSTNIETFIVKLVPKTDLQKASHLAQIAVGIIIPIDDDSLTETCSICCYEKLSSMMLTFKCSHRFCSHCMRIYVEGKVESAQVPIKCPELNCKYFISAFECVSFLPVTSYEDFEQTCECTFSEEDYSEERSQLALIHGYLAGGFGFIDDNNNRQQVYQSETCCTDSYAEVMKDLHQLPWLERFVSVISDDYYEDYIR